MQKFLVMTMLGISWAGAANAFQVSVPQQAGATVVYAAQELSEWTGKLTGTAPAVVTNSAPKTGVFVTLDPSLGDDEFRLVSKDGLYTISGGKRGVIYGVYETLERFGGIEFLASWHTFIPKDGKLRVPRELDEKHAPAYLMRNLWNIDPNNDAKFAVRLRCNANGQADLAPYGGGIWLFPPGASQCHTFSRMIPPKKYAATHPEYFCEIDGVRQTGEYSQLCLTNPEVLELAKRWARERLTAVPNATHLGVSHNDHASNYCRCKACAAVDAEEGSHMGTELRFVNAIADDVKTYRPDVIVQTLAYQYSRKLPKITRPRDNVMITLCSIECDRLRPFGAAKQHQVNLDFCRDFEDWSKVAKHLHIWDYLGENHHYIYPMLNSANIWPNLKYFYDHGVRYMFAELDGQSYHSEFMELKAYLAAKAMWNPDRDMEEYVDRFMNGYYGAAAPYVKKFWEMGRALAEKAPVDKFKVSIYQTDNPALYTQEYLEAGLKLWNQAEEAVKDDPACLYNVRFGKASVVRILLDRLSNGGKSIWVTRTPQRWHAPDPRAVEYERFLLDVRDASEARGQHLCFSNTPKRNERAYAQWRRYITMQVPEKGCDWVEIGPDRIEILEDFIARRIKDPNAIGGEAIEMDSTYEHPGIYLNFAFVAFDPGVEYKVRIHAEVKPKAGGRGEALKISVPGKDDVRLDVADLKPGYAWYETPPFRPSHGARVELTPGHRDARGGGSDAMDYVRVDRMEIVRVTK